MSAVVFKTPGLIDIRAFTVMGVNAKPQANSPIGYFGTGLKYAIAVLARHRIKVQLFIGDTEYEFYAKDEEFRDKTFAFVKMKKRKGLLSKFTYHDLPFTTELGKNWELWMAFRELESNTRDENGKTEVEDVNPDGFAEADHTIIAVHGNEFVDIYHDRDKYFLPDGLTMRDGNESVQVLDRPSKAVYYRSLRVHELKEEAQFTYNILRTIDLTEDRTAKYAFDVETAIAEYVAQQADKDRVKRIASRTTGFESRLGFSYVYGAPSKAFKEAVEELQPDQTAAGVLAYRDTYNPPAPKLPEPEVNDEAWTVIVETILQYPNEQTNELLEDLAQRLNKEVPAETLGEDGKGNTEADEPEIGLVNDEIPIPY